MSSSVCGEMRLLEYTQRLASKTRNVLATREWPDVAMAMHRRFSAGGAGAIAQGAACIAPGERADLIALDTRSLGSAEADPIAWLSTWVFAERAQGSLVRNAWVAGRRVLRDGVHAHAQRIRRDFARTMHKLRG